MFHFDSSPVFFSAAFSWSREASQQGGLHGNFHGIGFDAE
jgi:hypothetical protein